MNPSNQDTIIEIYPFETTVATGEGAIEIRRREIPQIPQESEINDNIEQDDDMPSFTFDENSSDENYSDETSSEEDKNVKREVAVPVSPGNELSARETAILCALLDPEEYPGFMFHARQAERVLQKVANGGAVLDKNEPRFVNDPCKYEDPRNPNVLTTQELWAVIQLQEGRKPTCSLNVVESALQKVQGGAMVRLEKEQEVVEKIQEALKISEPPHTNQTSMWNAITGFFWGESKPKEEVVKPSTPVQSVHREEKFEEPPTLKLRVRTAPDVEEPLPVNDNDTKKKENMCIVM